MTRSEGSPADRALLAATDILKAAGQKRVAYEISGPDPKTGGYRLSLRTVPE